MSTLDALTADDHDGQLTARTRANLRDCCATSTNVWFVFLHLDPLQHGRNGGTTSESHLSCQVVEPGWGLTSQQFVEADVEPLL
jgi:hypothetical protein